MGLLRVSFWIPAFACIVLFTVFKILEMQASGNDNIVVLSKKTSEVF